MEKGLFITFEGTDGCGKTTQIERLKDYFEAQGRKVIMTREPGAKGLGTKLREILLNYDGEVSSNCESFLFLADRAQHIDTLIKPAIERGEIVLCDRHIDSTVAYQGYGRGLDLDRIHMLNEIATSGMKPDITFVFDIDVETAQERVGKTKDRMESAGLEFFKRVRQGFLEIAKSEPKRVKVLDATQTRDEISEQVVEYVNLCVKHKS
ncbi:dTMP kinase [bacterium]|nr:dTMP kinase [bacterium]